MVEIVRTPPLMRQAVLAARAAGRRIGFVPTMGALHAGHGSLIARAAAECDDVAVSIFVNPTQFGPTEDFERYPRRLEADCDLLSTHGARWVFAPEAATIYPPGDATRVVVGGPAGCLEGDVRPGHFEGVATVVCRLILAVPADVAYFGAKDWQQTLVVKRMVCDLGMPIDVVVCPTVREPDGLAMSSRNAHLSAAERQRAIGLSESLCRAEEMWMAGATVAAIEQSMRDVLAAHEIAVDYAAVVDLESLKSLEESAYRPPSNQESAYQLPSNQESAYRPTMSQVSAGMAIAMVAGRLGSTRLIDNRQLPTRRT